MYATTIQLTFFKQMWDYLFMWEIIVSGCFKFINTDDDVNICSLCNQNKHQNNNNAIPVVQLLQELVFRDQCGMNCYKSEAVTGKTIRSCRVTASVHVTVQLCSSAVNHQQQFCWRSSQRGTCLREHIPCKPFHFSQLCSFRTAHFTFTIHSVLKTSVIK